MPEFPVVPPHEAGQQIRVLATQLYEVLSKPPSGSGQSFQTTFTVSQAWEKCRATHLALHMAMERRKLTEMRPALADYKEAVRQWRNTVYLEATQQISAKKVKYPYTTTGMTVTEAIERLRELANNLPTQPDLPSADSRDTCLRAIIAVLRTHKIPEAENLTHHAKEDPNGTTETVGDEAASESKPGHIDLNKVIDALDKPYT